MTQAQLSATIGVLISLAFTIVPGLKTWFDKRSPSEKQQVMAILVITTGFVVSGLSCTNFGGINIPCTRDGLMTFFSGVVVNSVLALAGNQSTWAITRKVGPEQKDGAVG